MSIAQQEKIADNLVAGVVQVFNADQPNTPFQSFGPRMTEEMPASRIEHRAGNFARGSDHMNKNAAGAWYYDHRRGFYSFTVVSQRHTQTAQGPDSKHGEAVGRGRFLFSIVTQKLLPANVSSYQIADIIDQGDSYSYDEAKKSDRTEVRFQIDLVLPSANYAAT